MLDGGPTPQCRLSILRNGKGGGGGGSGYKTGGVRASEDVPLRKGRADFF